MVRVEQRQLNHHSELRPKDPSKVFWDGVRGVSISFLMSNQLSIVNVLLLSHQYC